jgi:hypothetical protein
VRRERSAVIHESVDLLYNLVVLWSELGITSAEIWAEMDRRQALFGMAEKLPKEVEVGAMPPIGDLPRRRSNTAKCASPQRTGGFTSSRRAVWMIAGRFELVIFD